MSVLRDYLLALDEVLTGYLATRVDRPGADRPGSALLATHARHADPPPGPLRGPVAPPAVFDEIARRFGLSELDRWILAVAAAPDVDSSFGQLFGTLSDRSWSRVPLDVLDALAPWFGADRFAVHRRLDPGTPLVAWGLATIIQAPGDRPYVTVRR